MRSRDHEPTAGIALEFGGYLADAADAYLDFMGSGESEIDFDARSDLFRGLRSAAYEFRKRAPSSAKPAFGDSSRDALEAALAEVERLKGEYHRRGVKIIEMTEHAGAHLCRAEAAETALSRLKADVVGALERATAFNSQELRDNGHSEGFVEHIAAPYRALLTLLREGGMEGVLQTNVAPQCGVGPSDLTGQGSEP